MQDAETITVDDLEFDPVPFSDMSPEPDDHADAVFDEASEIAGLHVKLLIGITEFAYQHADDKDALDALKTVFHWNPKHLIKAYERFPGTFESDRADELSWESIVGAWTLGRVKDDEAAQKLFLDWNGYSWDLAQLRDAVKAANATDKPKAAPLAERCAALVEYFRAPEGENAEFDAGTRMAGDMLAALPEVRRVLEAKPKVSDAKD